MEWQSITMWDCNSLSVYEHVKVFNHCQSGTFCRKRKCSYQEREVGNYKVTGETSTLGRSVHNIVQKKKLFLYYTHLPLATVVVHSPMGTASLTIFCVQATDKEVRTHARMTSPPLYTYQGRGNHGDTYQGRGNHGDTYQGRGNHGDTYQRRGNHGDTYQGRGNHGDPSSVSYLSGGAGNERKW